MFSPAPTSVGNGRAHSKGRKDAPARRASESWNIVSQAGNSNRKERCEFGFGMVHLCEPSWRLVRCPRHFQTQEGGRKTAHLRSPRRGSGPSRSWVEYHGGFPERSSDERATTNAAGKVRYSFRRTWGPHNLPKASVARVLSDRRGLRQLVNRFRPVGRAQHEWSP